MKKTAFLILGLVLLGTVMASLPLQGTGEQCGGGVNIYACPDRHGCIIPQGGGAPIYFATDKTGYAFVGDLCAGNYSVCVLDCGTGTFYSNGASEIVLHITNNADCNCP